MWNPAGIAEQVRTYLSAAFLTPEQAHTLSNSDQLLTVLDSLQLLRMVIELESRFEISIDNREINLENLGTIDRIADFIASKRNS